MAMKTGGARFVLLLAVFAVLTSCGGRAGGTRTDLSKLALTERQADEAYQGDRNKEAVALYRSLLELMPEEPAYWYRLANTLVRMGHDDEAAIAYQQALSLEPGNARAWHNLGVVRLRQAQTSFARSVRNSESGHSVFEESLRLSAAVINLTGQDREPRPHPAATGSKMDE